MKILFGVQGTGNGHITRARIMAKAFEKRDDIQVDYLFSGRAPEKYFDMDVFGHYKTATGLSFVTQNGAIDYWSTLTSIKFATFIKDVKALDLSHYDLVLNDFEPISAWAAKRQGVPAISLSHQAAFSHPIPVKGLGLIDKFITQYFAPTKVQLGIHWYHFNCPILPPFIDGDAPQKNPDKSILVYLPFENIAEIQQALATFAEQDFICFHPEVSQAHINENVIWHPTAKAPFKAALARCRGVIANAGFEIASECLHFNKNMLLKPLAGQFEQQSNASTLADLGLCQLMQSIDLEVIEQWLQTDAGQAVEFATDPNILIDWLMERKWDDTQSLCQRLWQQVTFPPSVQRSLSHLSF